MPASAYPIPYTLLSISRAARMLGIAPAHFMGATASSLTPAVFPTGSACGDVWPRYDWQKSDQVSHESFANAIKDAEEAIAREIGYWPAPMWIAAEQHTFPRDLFRENIFHVRDVRLFAKGIKLNYGRVISGGRRGATLVDNVRVAYSDEDADGLFETAAGL